MPNKKPYKIDFKIIAIKPLPGCNTELLKILKENQLYYFYNDYKVDEGDIIKYKKTHPENLYDYRRLKINICAIAGKNGSGKSTIIDLLLMAVNNIALHFKVKDDLEPVNGLKVSLFIHLDEFIKITVIGENVIVNYYDEFGKPIESGNHKTGEFKLSNMFYTIAMNYSHYAYNKADYINPEQGDWLSALFHKNDAYQTPLVINPWRDNGNIIIDRENELVKSRLIANLLRPSGNSTFDFRNITENLRATELTLAINDKKIRENELYRKKLNPPDKNEMVMRYAYQDLVKLKKDLILTKINKAYNFGYETYRSQADDLEKLAMDYLIRKLITISIKYEEYHDNYLISDDDFDYKKLTKYIGKVVADRSHIAFKLRQTLNYLRHKHIKLDKEELQLDKLSETIQNVINKKKTHRDKVIDLIPPPIFSVDIKLIAPKENETNIMFRLLSSGEKQMVYSISSILYHLVNLDSVLITTEQKVQYRMIQIVLEEIELYFHPEMQRTYVKFLRDSLINLELKHIKNISICFVTHSPFILSDIPNSNVMSLQIKDGKAVQVNQNRKTFAANIHNLLADSFFMQDGLCGAYAIECINDTIKFLNEGQRISGLKRKLEDEPDNEDIANEIENWEINISDERIECHALLIKNIAEPIIEIKLSEMFDEIFPKSREREIRAQIAKLQALLPLN